jgi:amidase
MTYETKIPCKPKEPAMHSSAAGLSTRSTRDLVAALAARELSASELLEATIARIERVDGAINAVPVRDFERARGAAAAADDALARGERRPLLGIPMTVKESFNVAGLPTTWGFPQSAHWRAAEDAVAIARLKTAGAVIAGKTNVPFGLGDWQSYNDVYGTTNNPWDRTRSPGGSSGGSAASLAAGYVSLELGSDVGGSLRAPAHFCGVFSHKPTYGLVPIRGQAPPGVEFSSPPDMTVAGPLATSAGDLALALDVLAGPDDADAKAYRLALPPPRHTGVRAYRVLVLDEHPDFPASAGVRGAVERVATELVKAGASVARGTPLLPDLARNARTFTGLLFAAMAARWPRSVIARLQAAAAALDPADDSLAAARTRGAVMSHSAWMMLDGERIAERARWRELFHAFDVVVCPAMPTEAFPHDHSPDFNARRIDVGGTPHSYPDQVVWAGVPTAVGLPATTVPIERSADGLPVGVQVVGARLEDRTTIAFAAILEEMFGGFVAPAET